MATIIGSRVTKLVVACDAAMGSGVVLASTLRGQLQDNNVTVEQTPVNAIPSDADVVVCHEALVSRARRVAPEVPIVAFKVFLADPAVTRIVEAIRTGTDIDV